MPLQHIKFNLKRDPHDERDHMFKLSTVPIIVPSKVDLSSKFPPVWHQGSIGSCTGHGVAAVLKFVKKTLFQSIPSRLFIYTNAKVVDGSDPTEDSGASIRSALKGVGTYKCVDETVWKYSESNACITPPTDVYKKATEPVKMAYERVPQSLNTIKGCLFNNKPIVIGIQCYESLMDPATMSTGQIPIPNTVSETSLGGHCIVLCGYDDATQSFLLRNSWGNKVGLPQKRGYFTIPYAYIINRELTSDLWTLTVASS
jgi:C1A family cysteine protease